MFALCGVDKSKGWSICDLLWYDVGSDRVKWEDRLGETDYETKEIVLNIETYNLDFLRKRVRSLQEENRNLKAQLDRANIAYELWDNKHFIL